MGHLLYLMFRCDFDAMKSLESLEEWEGTKHSQYQLSKVLLQKKLSKVLYQHAIHSLKKHGIHKNSSRRVEALLAT